MNAKSLAREIEELRAQTKTNEDCRKLIFTLFCRNIFWTPTPHYPTFKKVDRDWEKKAAELTRNLSASQILC